MYYVGACGDASFAPQANLVYIVSCLVRPTQCIYQILYTLQCIFNGQSSVTEKTPKDGRIIRHRIISYYSLQCE